MIVDDGWASLRRPKGPGRALPRPEGKTKNSRVAAASSRAEKPELRPELVQLALMMGPLAWIQVGGL